MGTIEQKLNKIIQTKNRLRANINGLGGELTEESTFASYPIELSKLYQRLPKTPYYEGTNINLGKTLKAVVEYEDNKVLYGDTSQETTNGYNLAKPINYNRGSAAGITWGMQGGIITASGTATSSTQSVTTGNVPSDEFTTLPSGSYIVSGANGGVNIQVLSNTSTLLATDSGSGATFTLAEETTLYYRGACSNGTALTGTVEVKVMIESGSTAHTWEKYTGRYCFT